MHITTHMKQETTFPIRALGVMKFSMIADARKQMMLTYKMMLRPNNDSNSPPITGPAMLAMEFTMSTIEFAFMMCSFSTRIGTLAFTAG